MRYVFFFFLLVLACDAPKKTQSYSSGASHLSPVTSTWFINPTSGTDTNVCTTSGAPCKTFSEIVNNRYGTSSPVLSSPLTITWQADDIASDPVIFTPTITQGGGLTLNGTLIQTGTATIGTVVHQNPATATLNSITASGQSGAFWTPFVGQTVHDTTAGAQFFVIADLGGATAQISAPKAYPVTEFGADVSISNGDTLTIYRPSVVYFTRFLTTTIGNGSGGGAFINQMGITGDSFPIFGNGIGVNESTITNATIVTDSSIRAYAGPVFTSCYFSSGFGGGAPFSGIGILFGGALQQAGNNFLDGSTLDGDVVIPLRIHTAGAVKFGRVYLGQTPTTDNPTTVYNIINQNAGSARVWGPAGLSVINGSHVLITNGPAASTLLLTGTLALESTTGFPWVAASHVYGAGVTITAAAIDANGGLVNPATDSGYVFP